jgi:hypothetical protein
MVRPSAAWICSPVSGCRARATAAIRRVNRTGSANTRPMRCMIATAGVPASRDGSAMPNISPKLSLTLVTVPCSPVISTPGMAEAIRQFSRSVWSASAACERSSPAMSLACRIWVATMAATACAVARTSSSQAVTSPIRASAHRHCPPAGTGRASSRPPGGPPAAVPVAVPVVAVTVSRRAMVSAPSAVSSRRICATAKSSTAAADPPVATRSGSDLARGAPMGPS